MIKETRVQPVTNVNFSISVGTRVPRDVHFHALPPRVVTIYPEWRSYKYILVKEQIVIIDPDTYEIVAVLESKLTANGISCSITGRAECPPFFVLGRIIHRA